MVSPLALPEEHKSNMTTKWPAGRSDGQVRHQLTTGNAPPPPSSGSGDGQTGQGRWPPLQPHGLVTAGGGSETEAADRPLQMAFSRLASLSSLGEFLSPPVACGPVHRTFFYLSDTLPLHFSLSSFTAFTLQKKRLTTRVRFTRLNIIPLVN
jgi:hypothetical protein